MMLGALRERTESEPPILHGGRLDRARRMFPEAPSPWIDLSTGVNPRAYPLQSFAPDVLARLPDAEALQSLERKAARAYDAGAATQVVAGAGAQAFIQWLPRLFPARRVAVLAPTYEEHAASWRASGADVEHVTGFDALGEADAAVIVNPNNPDGRFVAAERVAALGERMAKDGRLLVVDEAFMDMLGRGRSVVPSMPEGMVVLRSFGKAYGLPGLRLGFALCGEAMAARLRQALGPWCVSGPAIAAGLDALGDDSWLVEQARVLKRDALRLDALLTKAGFAMLGGTHLFRLASHARAGRWFSRLGERGVLVRSFAAEPSWLRFGLPGSARAWERLEAALEGADGA